MKLIHAGRVLETGKTIAESKVHAGDLPGGVITMHVSCSLQLLKRRQKNKMNPLKNMAPAAQYNIDAKFILVEKGKVTIEGGQYKTCLALVADETAAVHFQLWGDECDAFEPGDIIQLSKGIFSYNRNSLVLRAGKRGKIEKVGEFTMAFVETPNLSEIQWVLDPLDNKYVQQSVVSSFSRVFPPPH